MSRKYIRSGKDLQYLHRAGCSRYHWWHHALGVAVRWQWADNAPRTSLVAAVRMLDIKVCRSCAPLGDRREVRSPR